MRDIFIITPNGYDLQTFAKAARGIGWPPTEAGDIVSLWSGDDYVDFCEAPDVAKHYDEAEWSEVRACGPNPRFFCMRFHDYKVAARVILSILPATSDFILDNDHGLILPLHRFAALKPTIWDWTIADSPSP